MTASQNVLLEVQEIIGKDLEIRNQLIANKLRAEEIKKSVDQGEFTTGSWFGDMRLLKFGDVSQTEIDKLEEDWKECEAQLQARKGELMMWLEYYQNESSGEARSGGGFMRASARIRFDLGIIGSEQVRFLYNPMRVEIPFEGGVSVFFQNEALFWPLAITKLDELGSKLSESVSAISFGSQDDINCIFTIASLMKEMDMKSVSHSNALASRHLIDSVAHSFMTPYLPDSSSSYGKRLAIGTEAVIEATGPFVHNNHGWAPLVVAGRMLDYDFPEREEFAKTLAQIEAFYAEQLKGLDDQINVVEAISSHNHETAEKLTAQRIEVEEQRNAILGVAS